MSGMFVPDQYWTGNLAESWEITDPQTVTVYLREGILWQDKPPVNGREFVADDVVFHYDRMLGTGHGYTEPNPFAGMLLGNLQNVTATDDYTVVFHFKTPSPAVAFQTLCDRVFANEFEPPEAVAAQGGSITDWTGVVGTGPWILQDFVDGSSITCVKNPTYHGTDPRYGNPVPYADEFVVLIMPDLSTQLAALRTEQIDLIDAGLALQWQQAQSLQDTDPELEWKQLPNGASGVSFRLDHAPFTDIRVRQALQMAIDREGIAESYYGGFATANPVGMVTAAYTGWAYAYEDWSQELKDRYVYDPEAAKALLAEAAADGIFTPNELGGFDTDILASTTGDLQLLQLFQDEFKDIGVDMTINAVDWPTYEKTFRAAEHDQMVTFGGGSTWPPTRTVSQWYSQGPDNGATRVNSAEYDALYQQFQSASSLAEAAQIFQQCDKLVIENHWAVFAPESYIFLFWQPYLKGYSGEACQWGRGVTYAKLWKTE
jgi:peptide/nickel transport system substrate-binding protein